MAAPRDSTLRASRANDLAAALAGVTAPDRVSTTPPDRVAYARDLWPRGLLAMRAGDVAPFPPDVIVWPESTREVQAIVRVAQEQKAPVVAYGGGSGVCGGTVPIQGGIVVDVKRMRRLLDLDTRARTASFEAGVLGDHLEHELNRRGYSLGHFPSSIMCSTLGGWVATRSAGQCSARYGKIEDMVRDAEIVLGTAEVIEVGGDAPSAGPDLLPLLVGSEGTLGIFTRARLAVHPLPEARVMRGFRFARLASGLEGIRRVMQRGLRPAVMRLYDELDTVLHRRAKQPIPHVGKPGPSGGGFLAQLLPMLGIEDGAALQKRLIGAALDRPGNISAALDAVLPRLGAGCRMVFGCEGDARLAAAEARAVAAELESAGGEDQGPGPGEEWLAHRYDVSFGLSKVFALGAFADTMEVATTWDRLLVLYDAVRKAVAPYAFVMAHFSHAYPDGCSIYFTFFAAVPGGDAARAPAERRYDQIWKSALGAVNQVGATISHHHGIGVLKASFMSDEHGEAMGLLRALKEVCDPHGIMNPGKLGL